jgi:hypothetical protein
MGYKVKVICGKSVALKEDFQPCEEKTLRASPVLPPKCRPGPQISGARGEAESRGLFFTQVRNLINKIISTIFFSNMPLL